MLRKIVISIFFFLRKFFVSKISLFWKYYTEHGFTCWASIRIPFRFLKIYFRDLVIRRKIIELKNLSIKKLIQSKIKRSTVYHLSFRSYDFRSNLIIKHTVFDAMMDRYPKICNHEFWFKWTALKNTSC